MGPPHVRAPGSRRPTVLRMEADAGKPAAPRSHCFILINKNKLPHMTAAYLCTSGPQRELKRGPDPLRDPTLPLSNLYSCFVFFLLKCLRPGVVVLHLKSIMETVVYCLGMLGVGGLPPILCTSIKGHKCLTLVMLHDSAKVEILNMACTANRHQSILCLDPSSRTGSGGGGPGHGQHVARPVKT